MTNENLTEPSDLIDPDHQAAMIIEVPVGLLPTYGHSQDGARPHVEVSGSLLHYVIVERGEELLREYFSDLPSLLERIFRSIASDMASAYECRHRRESEDFRRQMFAKQLEYLGTLDPAWAKRERRRLNQILSSHPFTDGLDPIDWLP